MGPSLVDADWYAYCQALYKGIEGKDWEEMYDSYKEMSKASAVEKPQEVACDRVVPDLMLPLWEEVLWPFLDAWDTVRLEIWVVWRALLLPSGKEPMVLRELSRLEPSIRPHGELLLLLKKKKPTFVPDSEAFNSYIGDGFLVPELKDESEASKDEQADSSSENNVGNGALFVIGLHDLPTQLPSS